MTTMLLNWLLKNLGATTGEAGDLEGVPTPPR